MKQRIISEIYDENTGEIISQVTIMDKVIEEAKEMDQLGFTRKDSIEILKNIQEEYLKEQSKLLHPKKCPHCGAKTRLYGSHISLFHGVFSDHRLNIHKAQCTSCKKIKTTTIKGLFGNNKHRDLLKAQIMKASEMSFVDAQKSLDAEVGEPRSVNCQNNLKVFSNQVGSILKEVRKEDTSSTEQANTLIIGVDGGYIKSNKDNRNRFEALVGKIYRPEKHVIKNNKNSRNSCTMSSEYVASAIADRGSSFEQLLIAAARRQGLNEKTHVLYLSDGANNCWKAASLLLKLFKVKITKILDWWHIQDKLSKLDKRVKDDQELLDAIDSVRWSIWNKSDKMNDRISSLIELVKNDITLLEKVVEFKEYIANNSEYLVNYKERKENNEPFTSSFIESAVEKIINKRHKKQHKAQWSKDGADNILQIRTAAASDNWDKTWDNLYHKMYKKAA